MRENHILPFVWMRGEEEAVLREEMAKIEEAGIRAVCLEARPHPDYAGEQWWHDVDIMIDEAQKRDMKIWILDDAHFPTGMANDSMKNHPDQVRRFFYSYFVDVTGPVPAAQVDVETLTQRRVTWMDLGKPMTKPMLDETRLLSVTCSKICDGDTIEGTPMDVTAQVKDGYLTMDVPAGTWRIHVNFVTTDIGPKPEYINYIEKDSVKVLIDAVYEKHYERYKDLFGTTIAGFFSDEPGFYNNNSYGPDNHLGIDMTLPWGAELEQMMKEAYGENLYRDLPYFYSDEKDHEDLKLRTVYMDIVSKLYGKNFTSQLGEWCQAHGVEYIGHIVEDNGGHMRLGAGVGHYFRAIEGQHMAGIDNIGYQLMPGNDVANRHTGFQDIEPEFYHYELGKLGSSAAAIDPKKQGRTMCENLGAYGWRLGVRDQKWLMDYLINQGVNYFVPHAFSMAEYPDSDCPPHFHARGLNPQFPYFCEMAKYTNRLCDVFSFGQNVPQVGLLYEAEADWVGKAMPTSTVSKALMGRQIDFEILPADIFTNHELCQVTEGQLVVNDRHMKALIVPECDYIPAAAVTLIAASEGLPVFYINRLPLGIVGCCDVSLEQALEKGCVVPLDELADTLVKMGIHDEVYPEVCDANLHIYPYAKDGKRLYHMMNVSLSETVDVQLCVGEGSYELYDAMSDSRKAVPVVDGRIALKLLPYGAIVLEKTSDVCDPSVVPVSEAAPKQKLLMDTFDLELLEMCSAEPEIVKDFKLAPVSASRVNFSGVMNYTGRFELAEVPEKAVFAAQYVYECMQVTVNGQKLPAVIVPPYRTDITEALQAGENTIQISVASTPLRNANTMPSIFGKERAIIEPTGMFGEVGIELY